MADDFGPDNTSSDHEAMLPYWQMVETIMAGAGAMRSAGTTYLPQFPRESAANYELRRVHAKFTNIYRDIVENLAAKPFTQKVTVKADTASPLIAGDENTSGLVDDIDGMGNHLHVFAANLFQYGINDAISWILVEFTRATPRPDGQPLSLADERAQNLRPYWVHVPAPRMLAVYSDVVDGKEIFTHCRIQESNVQRDGYKEVVVHRIREFDRPRIATVNEAGAEKVSYGPAVFRLWESKASADGKSSQWEVVDNGDVTIGIIPIVPYLVGRRLEGSWRVLPPMQDAAYLQVEHYQQENELRNIRQLTGFPMLAANGVDLRDPANPSATLTVPVGPSSVLCAPPSSDGSHGEWNFIEPSATSLKFLADNIKITENQLRELGRQPLTAQTGNLTVVTTAFAAQKGSSAIQAWALNLKDALEQAFVLTCKWLNDTTSKPVVMIDTDFDVEIEDSAAPQFLLSMRSKNDISQRTLWSEAKRRGFLSADFDADAEVEELARENEGIEPEEPIDPRTGQPVAPDPMGAEDGSGDQADGNADDQMDEAAA